MTTRAGSRKPKGFRRVERWGVGVVMGIVAFVLEKVVLRSVRRKGNAPKPEGTMFKTSGAEADLEEF
jgi:hypothetical protein